MPDDQLSVCCECTPVLDYEYGGESGRSPAGAIVAAIAVVEGVAPMELDPLYDEIDPEALDQLFEPIGGTRQSTKICRVTVGGWNVFVRDDGAIRVCDPDRPAEPASVFERPPAD